MSTKTRPKWVVERLADVASFFGVKYQTVKGGWRGNGMPGKPGAWDLKAILEWRRESEPQGVVEGLSGDECLDSIEQFGQSILADDDLLQQALQPLQRDERRAIAIELIHYLVDIFADLSGMSRKAVFRRLEVMDEFEKYPDVISALKVKLGVEEK